MVRNEKREGGEVIASRSGDKSEPAKTIQPHRSRWHSVEERGGSSEWGGTPTFYALHRGQGLSLAWLLLRTSFPPVWSPPRSETSWWWINSVLNDQMNGWANESMCGSQRSFIDGSGDKIKCCAVVGSVDSDRPASRGERAEVWQDQ